MEPRDANDLMSMPVMATDSGSELGRVKDVLFDPSSHSLLGLMVSANGGGGAVMFLQRGRIKGLGQDAITVEGEAALQPFATAGRAREIVDSGIHLRGASVLTEGGDAIGKVDKVLVNEDGSVASYQVAKGLLGFASRREIPPSEVLSIGEDAVIVSNRAAELGEEGPLAGGDSDEPRMHVVDHEPHDDGGGSTHSDV